MFTEKKTELSTKESSYECALNNLILEKKNKMRSKMRKNTSAVVKEKLPTVNKPFTCMGC